MNPRVRVLAYTMMAPAMAAAFGLVGIEAYRRVNPEAELFGAPPARTFLEAVQRGNQGMEEAYSFVAGGLDPNGQITVADGDLTGGQPVTTTPLMLAVAAGNRNVVMMLLNFGARLDLPQHTLAMCLARQVGNDDVVSVLERHAKGRPFGACPDGFPGGQPPLVASVAGSKPL